MNLILNIIVLVKKKREYYLNWIIKEEKPVCEEHNREIKFICEVCKEQLCEQCKNCNPNDHQIKNIINCEVISESIMENISLKKDDYKGFNVFEKIFNLYKFSTIFIESVKATGIIRKQKISMKMLMKSKRKMVTALIFLKVI